MATYTRQDTARLLVYTKASLKEACTREELGGKVQHAFLEELQDMKIRQLLEDFHELTENELQDFAEQMLHWLDLAGYRYDMSGGTIEAPEQAMQISGQQEGWGPIEWYAVYMLYRDTVENKVPRITQVEKDSLYAEVEPALVGLSEAKFSELRMVMTASENELRSKRVEIDTLLVNLYHFLNRFQTRRQWDELWIGVALVNGGAEYYGTGSSQGLSETLYDIEQQYYHVRESNLRVRDVLLQIQEKVIEHETLRGRTISCIRQYYMEEKRRQKIRNSQW